MTHQLCNEIKHLFSVLKWCFHILLLTLEYSLPIQAHIPAAAAALHNFICTHEPLNQPVGVADPISMVQHRDALDPDHHASLKKAEDLEVELDDLIGDERCEWIVTAMWREYVELQRLHGILVANDPDALELVPAEE